MRTGRPRVSLDPTWHEESELYAFCVKHVLIATGVCIEVEGFVEFDDGLARLRDYEDECPTSFI